MPRRPIAKKISKANDQCQLEIITACRDSGLDGFAIVQIMADFYGWQKVVITSAPGITEHTVTNAWSRSKARTRSAGN